MAAVERRGARGSNRGTRLSFAIWPRKSLDSSSRVNFTCSGPQARSVLAPRPSTCTPRTPSPAPPLGIAATVYMVHARSSHRNVGGRGKGPFEPGGSTAVSCFSRKGFAVMGHRTVVSGFLSVVRAWRGGGGRVRRGGPQVLAGGRAGEQVDVWGWVRVGGVGVGVAGAGGGCGCRWWEAAAPAHRVCVCAWWQASLRRQLRHPEAGIGRMRAGVRRKERTAWVCQTSQCVAFAARLLFRGGPLLRGPCLLAGPCMRGAVPWWRSLTCERRPS